MDFQTMQYFKFSTALIESGLWAQMSSAARTLYPVLLRFTDRNFKPVYPGSQVLLKLTGFKQKSSLRKARRELEKMGLISVTEGTGRTNTVYHFRFDRLFPDAAKPPAGEHVDTPLESSTNPPRVAKRTTAGESQNEPLSRTGKAPGAGSEHPPYNQIHISINNHVPDEEKFTNLEDRYGKRNVELARSECKLAGIPDITENLENILSGRALQQESKEEVDPADLFADLEKKISEGSLSVIQDAFRDQKNGLLIFSDRLPEYLKAILKKTNREIFFEPEMTSARKALWNGGES